VLVASNHIAGLDPIVSGTAVPFECWFIAKLELFKNPMLARLIARFNAIPIRRGTADYETLDRAVELLKKGRNVLMFAEGTRQKPGKLGEARWGFGYVAAQSGRPIVPVFVRGTKDGRPRFFRRQIMEACVGEPMRARIAPGIDPHELYKELGARAMEQIEALMLRSAAETPLPGLELPGRHATNARPPEQTELSTRA
jgi:1-acyl-sn-glycerol-3-phosphate acyltransferase